MLPCNFCGLIFTDALELDTHIVTHIAIQHFDSDHPGNDKMQSDSLAIKNDLPAEDYPEELSCSTTHEGGQVESACVKLEPGVRKCVKQPIVLQGDDNGSHHEQTEGEHIDGSNVYVSSLVNPSTLSGKRQTHLEGTSGTLDLTSHSTDPGEKPHACDRCDATFTSSSNLSFLEITHTGEKPFKRDQCLAAFSNSSKLGDHRKKHTRKKPYKCDQCISKFSYPSQLSRHRCVHTGERPHKCDHCGAKFTRLSNLLAHKRIHTGEKPHKCAQCKGSFISSSALTVHMRIHTGEKPYKCNQCTKAFPRSENLAGHMLTHRPNREKPYKCGQCNAAFSLLSNLKVHMRTHTGEKPYKCSQCDAEFAYSGGLSRHKITHTGVVIDIRPQPLTQHQSFCIPKTTV